MEILLFKFNSASAKGNPGEENLSSLLCIQLNISVVVNHLWKYREMRKNEEEMRFVSVCSAKLGEIRKKKKRRVDIRHH